MWSFPAASALHWHRCDRQGRDCFKSPTEGRSPPVLLSQCVLCGTDPGEGPGKEVAEGKGGDLKWQ